MKRTANPVVAFILTCLLAIGASSASAQQLDLSPLPTGSQVDVRIGVGGTATVTHIAIWLAAFGGFFDALQSEGINVEVIPFRGGADAILALVGGQVQFSFQFAEHAISARAQGRDLQVLLGALPVPALRVLVRSDLADEIKEPSDISRRSWGFTGFGAGSHVVSLRVAQHYGIDPAYIAWTPVGGTAGYAPAIREARVEVLTAGEPSASELIKEGSAVELVDLTDPVVVQEVYGHPYYSAALLGTPSFVNENPYVTYRVIGAMTEALEFLLENADDPAVIAAMLPEQFQTPAIEEAIATLAPVHSRDGRVSADVLDAMIQDMIDLKLISSADFVGADVADTRFVDAVQSSR